MSWQTTESAVVPGPDPSPDPSSPGETLTVSAVQSRTGLSARTLRYYEEVGLLPGVRRRAGGRRVYGEAELERLRFITRLKALGLSLSEIKDLNAVYAIGGSTRAMLRRLAELLDRHLADVDARIGELSALRTEIHRYREHVARRVGAAGTEKGEGA